MGGVIMDELRPIVNEAMTTNYKEIVRKGIKADWIFDKLYEKLILTFSVAWSIYSILRFLYALF